MRGACQGGHKDLVYLMIGKGAHQWDNGLYNACQGGHIDLARIMIENGARNFNWGLEGARKGGHDHLILFMIENGANIDTSYPTLSNDSILYLMHRRITKFGKYAEIEKMWKMWLQIATIELNNVLIPDLAGIAAAY